MSGQLLSRSVLALDPNRYGPEFFLGLVTHATVAIRKLGTPQLDRKFSSNSARQSNSSFGLGEEPRSNNSGAKSRWCAAVEYRWNIFARDSEKAISKGLSDYYRVIRSAPKLARSASSFEDSPLTATAPITSPSFRTGTPPPQPTNLGSPK